MGPGGAPSWLLAVSVFLLTPMASAQEDGVVLREVTVTGLSPLGANLVELAVQAELTKYQGVRVITPDDVQRVAKDMARTRKECVEDRHCLAELGERLGARWVVTASVIGLGNSRVLTLKRIGLVQGSVEALVNRRFVAAGGEEILMTLGAAVGELFMEHELRPGATRGPPEGFVTRLDPPPFPPALFWGGLALTGVGVGAMIYAFAREGAAVREYLELGVTATQEPVEGKTFIALQEEAVRFRKLALASMAGTLVVGLATAGVGAVWTDWHRGEDPASLLGLPPGAAAAVPQFVPLAGGGMAVWTWPSFW